MKAILTIAGSDCSGGAGIQADLKTITMHCLYGMSAITALTAQNTQGITSILEGPPDFLSKQLECIFQDILPHAVKIGMVANSTLIEVIAYYLDKYRPAHIVIDPVMSATTGSSLNSTSSKEALITQLFPLASLITPNLHELQQLSFNNPIHTKSQMLECAKELSLHTGKPILAKGGHLEESASDLLYLPNGTSYWFETEKINNPNTHGTGCTLSSAIACNLALGHTLPISIQYAKDYVTGAISDGLNLGYGNGPLNHCYKIQQV